MGLYCAECTLGQLNANLASQDPVLTVYLPYYCLAANRNFILDLRYVFTYNPVLVFKALGVCDDQVWLDNPKVQTHVRSELIGVANMFCALAILSRRCNNLALLTYHFKQPFCDFATLWKSVALNP